MRDPRSFYSLVFYRSYAEWFARCWWYGPVPRCETCGRKRHELAEDIRLSIYSIGRHGFVEALWNDESLPVFREDVIDLWLSRGLTGFYIRPVQIIGWAKKKASPPRDMPRYYALFVTGRADFSSGTVIKSCDACGFKWWDEIAWHTMYVDPLSWDGSDFFSVSNGDVLQLCTSRVARSIFQAGFRQIAFVRAQERESWLHRSLAEKDRFFISRVEDL